MRCVKQFTLPSHIDVDETVVTHLHRSECVEKQECEQEKRQRWGEFQLLRWIYTECPSIDACCHRLNLYHEGLHGAIQAINRVGGVAEGVQALIPSALPPHWVGSAALSGLEKSGPSDKMQIMHAVV